MWDRPHHIDTTATTDVAVPAAWRAALPGRETVAVLPIGNGQAGGMPGWCTTGGQVIGPEIEIVCGGINTKQPTYAGVWRQGNLLHFGFEPGPSGLAPMGRKLLLNGIAYIARFGTDRPIVRVRSSLAAEGPQASVAWLEHFLAASGDDAKNLADLFAEPWRQRIAALDGEAARAFVRQRRGALYGEGVRFLFDERALAFGLDLREPAALVQLVDRVGGDGDATARRLLSRLLPDGPGADTTPNNWRNWLRARARSLCHDPHSLVFRIDPVAQARRVDSASLRGAARADGDADRDAGAAALAAKVVVHHGGARALDDMRTFACTLGEVHYLWDRARGLLRIENHGTLPEGAVATPWQVIVYDTAADEDLIAGGGPAPRPSISGRGMFRDLIERVFLPLLLLEPSTSLQLLPDDDDGNHRLAAKIAGRGLDPTKTHTLVLAANGALLGIDLGPTAAARTNVAKVVDTTQVGPLLLPTRFVQEGGRRRETHYTAAEWNPAVPDGAFTSKELLLGGR